MKNWHASRDLRRWSIGIHYSETGRVWTFLIGPYLFSYGGRQSNHYMALQSQYDLYYVIALKQFFIGMMVDPPQFTIGLQRMEYGWILSIGMIQLFASRYANTIYPKSEMFLFDLRDAD